MDYQDDMQSMYADMASCIYAMKNLLVSKGLVTHEEFVESFQERLLTLQAAKSPHPFLLLTDVAHGKMPQKSDL